MNALMMHNVTILLAATSVVVMVATLVMDSLVMILTSVTTLFATKMLSVRIHQDLTNAHVTKDTKVTGQFVLKLMNASLVITTVARMPNVSILTVHLFAFVESVTMVTVSFATTLTSVARVWTFVTENTALVLIPMAVMNVLVKLATKVMEKNVRTLMNARLTKENAHRIRNVLTIKVVSHASACQASRK